MVVRRVLVPVVWVRVLTRQHRGNIRPHYRLYGEEIAKTSLKIKEEDDNKTRASGLDASLDRGYFGDDRPAGTFSLCDVQPTPRS